MKGALYTIVITFFVAIIIVGITVFVGGGLFKAESVTSILKSEDGGFSWQETEGLQGVNIYELVFDKGNPEKIYAGTEKSGLWIGKNNGEEWSPLQSFKPERGIRIFDIYEINDADNVLLLAVFENNIGKVLRATEESLEELYFASVKNFGVFGIKSHSATPQTYWIVSSDGGFYETKNSGRTWQIVERFSVGLLDLIDNPSSWGQLWALTSKDDLIRTDDAGRNWIDVSGFKEFKRNMKPQDIFFHNRSQSLFLGSDYGLLKSTNLGATWKVVPLIIPPEKLPITAVAVDPTNSLRIFAAAKNQLYVSEDGGISWRGQTLPTTRNVSKIIINPKNTTLMYIGLD